MPKYHEKDNKDNEYTNRSRLKNIYTGLEFKQDFSLMKLMITSIKLSIYLLENRYWTIYVLHQLRG